MLTDAVTDEEYDGKIDELLEWFRTNENLPKEIDRLLLKRFYKCMFFNMEDTKKLIEINYALRNKNSHVFLERDPNSAGCQQTFDYADMIPLPGLTKENYKVSLYRLRDYDPNKVNHLEDNRAFFMIMDCRFCMKDVEDEDTLSEGEVQIFDTTGYTMKHLTKLSISVLRVYMKFLQEALPLRLKAIHVINCPPYLDRIVSFLKPFMSTEVYKMLHFHKESIETLFDHIPREMLPEEYGGGAGKIDDLKKQIVNSLAEKRDYLMDPHQWKVQGSSPRRWMFF